MITSNDTNDGDNNGSINGNDNDAGKNNDDEDGDTNNNNNDLFSVDGQSTYCVNGDMTTNHVVYKTEFNQGRGIMFPNLFMLQIVLNMYKTLLRYETYMMTFRVVKRPDKKLCWTIGTLEVVVCCSSCMMYGSLAMYSERQMIKILIFSYIRVRNSILHIGHHQHQLCFRCILFPLMPFSDIWHELSLQQIDHRILTQTTVFIRINS